MIKATLEDVCLIQSGGTPSRGTESYWGGSIPWAKISDLEASGDGYISDTEEHISEEGLEAIRGRIFDDGTLLFAMYGSVGKAAIVRGSVSTNQAILGIKPDASRLDLSYLKFWLRSQQHKFDQDAQGVAQKNLSAGYVRSLEIPLPPLPEQKRIAAILDKADAIRRKRQQAIQLADDFLRAVFLDMFGDPVTNPKGWDLLPFSAVGTLDRGKSRHRPRNDPALLGGIHPLIQTGEVANSRGYIKEHSATYSDLGLAQSKKWDAGTLCITIAANIAKTGILTFPACFPDSVVGFIPNKHVTVEYVQHWLGFLQKNLEENAPQAAQKNINLEILRALLIPVPPKSEQEKFSSMVAGILTIEEKIASSSDALGNAFDALSQKAFSGQL
ncbi:TPA: restriction endonuclease subunit S [Pseudomonas aeruginosa]|nr:restriction endonuclease subunit S [Pseudomonas aeruginosa]HCF9524786.1 restriction endonuclease subunit S [Pseudomonas aeruginosa]HCF9564672.1 restriction endonuclease subunit S [Pseudomonas aeruginosa]